MTHDQDEAENFYASMAALEKAFKPNTTVDALKYREQISTLPDKGMKHSGFHAKWWSIYGKLYKLKSCPTMAECNQIMVKNVMNPYFAPLKAKLIVDSAKDYADDYDRLYTYMDFLDEALVIAQTIELAENWGVSGETAMVAVSGSDGGVFTGCYRCAGPHQVHSCGAKVCTKCGAKILDDSGKRIRHEARYCTSGGNPGGNAGRNRFSKGGDKGGNEGGKEKSSWAGKKQDTSAKGSKPSGGVSEILPDPTGMKSKHLKAYVAKANAVMQSRESGGGSKRKFESRDEWLAAEPDT
jgi:hypothetical protein